MPRPDPALDLVNVEGDDLSTFTSEETSMSISEAVNRFAAELKEDGIEVNISLVDYDQLHADIGDEENIVDVLHTLFDSAGLEEYNFIFPFPT